MQLENEFTLKCSESREQTYIFFPDYIIKSTIKPLKIIYFLKYRMIAYVVTLFFHFWFLSDHFHSILQLLGMEQGGMLAVQDLLGSLPSFCIIRTLLDAKGAPFSFSVLLSPSCSNFNAYLSTPGTWECW